MVMVSMRERERKGNQRYEHKLKLFSFSFPNKKASVLKFENQTKQKNKFECIEYFNFVHAQLSIF